jgi:hypothetical protein
MVGACLELQGAELAERDQDGRFETLLRALVTAFCCYMCFLKCVVLVKCKGVGLWIEASCGAHRAEVASSGLELEGSFHGIPADWHEERCAGTASHKTECVQMCTGVARCE